MYIHRRQFIVGPHPVQLDNRWKIINISQSLYLSYDKDLKVSAATDKDGNLWIILGIAIQSKPENKNPIDEILNSHTNEVKKLYSSWSGRWILIGAKEIHLDATGLLGCFYRTIKDNSGNIVTWASSSALLLTKLPNLEQVPKDSPLITHSLGMDWYPLPSSRFESINHLLPTQILNLSDGTIKHRGILKGVNKNNDYEFTIHQIQKHLVTIVNNFPKINGTMWLPLTAGFDSRVLLSLLHFTGVPFKTFTLEHESMSKADRTIPPLLAKEVGVSHSFIKTGEFSKSLLDLWDSHTGKQVMDSNRNFFSKGMWSWFDKEDILLGGGVFEVGRCFFWKSLPKEIPDAYEILNCFNGFYSGNEYPHTKALTEWIKWVNLHPIENVDWRDRFYLEQRVSGWASNTEQAMDLINCDRFYAVNSDDILSLLLSIPEDVRLVSGHQVELVRRMSPNISKFPYNPPDPLYMRIRKKIKRLRLFNLSNLSKKIVNKTKQVIRR